MNNVISGFVNNVSGILTAFTHYALSMVVGSLIQAIFIMLCWNMVIPDVIPTVTALSYAQAFLIIILWKVITSGWNSVGMANNSVKQTEQLSSHSILLSQMLYMLTNMYLILDQEFPDKTKNTETKIQINPETPIDTE